MSTAKRELFHQQHYSCGDALYKQGEYKSAIKEFEKALFFASGDSDTLWAIGDCFSELGYPKDAEMSYREALQSCREKKRVDLIYNIANALFDQMKYKEAIKLYESIPYNSPIFKRAKKNIKVAKRKIGRY